MLYDSTKALLRNILWSLEHQDGSGWEDQAESGRECLYEMHQMARPNYKAYRAEPHRGRPALVPVYEKAARAIPHVKTMLRAIRRQDRAEALASGQAALSEM